MRSALFFFAIASLAIVAGCNDGEPPLQPGAPGAESGVDSTVDGGGDDGSVLPPDSTTDTPVGDSPVAEGGDESDVQVEAGPCGFIGSACCEASVCEAGQCLGATCELCGNPGEQCCPSKVCAIGSVCTGGGLCTECGGAGEPCCAINDCSGGGCCVNGLCTMTGSVCPGTDGGVCTAGSCGGCGGAGEGCCGIDCTAPDTQCSGGGCALCGGAGRPCCSGMVCVGGTLVCNGMMMCQECGNSGEVCCAGNVCSAQLSCNGTTCN